MGLMDDDGQHIGKTEARAGTTPHSARYVLVISTGLIIIIFAILLFVWR